jgi:hypothetical protein
MTQDRRLFLCDKEGNPAIEVGGFGPSGIYMIEHENGGDPKWQVRCRYIAHSSDNPVAVIFPGYRMRGVEGYSCNKLAQGLHELSFPVLILDYGGTTDNKSEVADAATMTTQISDCAAAISYLGQRQHMHFPISFGINVSMQVITAYTQGVVGIVAAPDRMQRIIYPNINMNAASQRGYVRHDMGNGIEMKITAAFLADCLKYSLHDLGMGMRAYKPPIRLVAGECDEIVPLSYINDWGVFMNECGYPLDISVIAGQSHTVSAVLFFKTLQEALRMRDQISPIAGIPRIQVEAPEFVYK